MNEKFDTIVIGAGQAGLASGYYLARQGRSFVILDANPRVGDSWRQRWDSMQLFTPAFLSSLPGWPFPAKRHHIPLKDEMADYLEAYAYRFHLPVMRNVRIQRLSREGDRYILEAGDRRFEANQVIVATGAFQKPKIPAFAADLDPAIHQIHSSQYRSPEKLPPGRTLIAGVGNSGAQIAMDLAKTHTVWLSGSPAGRVPPLPEAILGPLIWFMVHYATRTDTWFGRMAKARLGNKGTPLEGLSEKDFKDAGVKRVPRTVGAPDGIPLLADGSSLEVDNVIWATGYRSDFSWIHLPVFDADGQPIHRRGVVESEPGLYFMGLMFIYSVSSALIGGVGRDAEYIAGKIAARFSEQGSERVKPAFPAAALRGPGQVEADERG